MEQEKPVMADEVLYEEVDGIAIVAINRPEKKSTLTENVVRAVAEGVDTASRISAGGRLLRLRGCMNPAG